MNLAPSRPRFNLWLEGIGVWTPELHDWPQLRDCLCAEPKQSAQTLQQRPAAGLLQASERRRAPISVLVAIEVATQAIAMSGREAAQMPSIFSCAHGDAEILDYTCSMLARSPNDISPIRFHNSVHNAAAGYWTIATGCHAASSAVAALEYSFAASLLEATMLAQAEQTAVLLVASDGPGHGPLAEVIASRSVFGCAMVISPMATDNAIARLDIELCNDLPADPPGQIAANLADGNLSARGMKLFEILATGISSSTHLQAGKHLGLKIQIEKIP